ncbi:MAG TPA: PEGA domain-containing protein [Candidatus Acidoferrales bacterium]|nr:PEGA domain-containing protein [Candidatus Acidoferrales bacterium]
MQPSRRKCLWASLAAATLFAFPPQTHADTLTISSAPTGASVEIDGKPCGVTPLRLEYPGGYFHKTHTVFGARLEHALTLKISKDGFVPQQITLTEGPYDWVSATGKRHGTYYLLKSNSINLTLDPLPPGVPSVNSAGGDGPMLPPQRFSHDQTALNAPSTDSKEPAGIASVQIATDPPGAEIYIDGKFVGQTPSTIKLPAGTHRIEVKSEGKQIWQRDMEVLRDSLLTLHPELPPAKSD